MGTTAADPVLASIQQALPDFLAARRWFRSKARTIASTRIHDVITAYGFPILLVSVEYSEGEADTYLLPITSSAHEGEYEETIARLETEDGAAVTVYSALAERGFRDVLFQALACGASFPGENGRLVAEPSPYFAQECQHALPERESFVSRAEQSNSSIIYARQYILKLFRKLEAGVNPDIEIGRQLTNQGFANSPAVLGMLEYETALGLRYAAGILQQFVPNEGDAWKYTLASLSDYFQRALSPDNQLEPVLPFEDYLLLMDEPVPTAVSRLIGPYLESAALLGRRTAEMHVALASSNEPDFRPEGVGPDDAAKLQAGMLTQAELSFHLLRAKVDTLTGTDAVNATALLSLETDVTARLQALRSETITTLRIRHHGDYHLGQVLYTGSDFMIIDFEGEPALPLAERRAKALALKDVAGMLRSFQYAAYSALETRAPAVEAWAAFWNGWVSAAFLKSYFKYAYGQAFAPASEMERRTLLQAFLLQKALYELAYELNNRPGWVGIPIRGILSLIE
jgi:maltose alpha-D-glucosyltransferase/alpha-amylase